MDPWGTRIISACPAPRELSAHACSGPVLSCIHRRLEGCRLPVSLVARCFCFIAAAWHIGELGQGCATAGPILHLQPAR
jgi:hypothetical protein